ncbi:hypothetical protein T4A_3813 [Trichinella pseudospiralis]|uniref:Uncharacterized protein n=1 Tax=Trichinella pseudospiralis TaxID=6337 RepID=A0A0V1EVP2_TRIPS|nr:hypothetical protein T4A_3813 [Trichinella pseudospiralis]
MSNKNTAPQAAWARLVFKGVKFKDAEQRERAVQRECFISNGDLRNSMQIFPFHCTHTQNCQLEMSTCSSVRQLVDLFLMQCLVETIDPTDKGTVSALAIDCVMLF